MSIYVIGDEDTVLGFQLVGIPGQAVEAPDGGDNQPQAVTAALDEALARQGLQVLLITRTLGSMLRERVDELKMTSLEPVIIEIPDREAVAGEAEKPLGRLIEEAIGMRLGL